MGWEQIAIGALGLLSGVGGWFLNVLWNSVQQLTRDLASLEVKISDKYVKTSEFTPAVDRILNAIDDLRRDLTHKADKQ